MENINRRTIVFIAVVAFIFSAQIDAAAQGQRKFKPGDRFEAGGGYVYEIQQCRVTNGEEECEFVAHKDGSPPSNPVWLSASMLSRFEQTVKDEKRRLDAINRRSQPSVQTEQQTAEPSNGNGPRRETDSPQDAELAVTAQQLYSDYRNNDTAAKRKYVGKTVRITGAVVYSISGDRFSATINKTFLGSTIQCYVEDSEQLTSLNTGETLTLVGKPLGSMTSTGVIFEPCRVERKTGDRSARPTTPKTLAKTTGNANAKIAGTWYYTAIVKADGGEQKLTNGESYLWLKDDGSYENRFGGAYGQVGTYTASGSRLTLNRENAGAKVYTMTLGDGGKTMTLRGSSGGYRLARE